MSETAPAPAPSHELAVLEHYELPVEPIRVVELVGKARACTISGREDMEAATDMVSVARAMYRKLEERRKEEQAPAKEQVERVATHFKLLTGPLMEALDLLKRKMTAYEQEERRKAREEQARLQKEQEDARLAEAARLEAEGKRAEAEHVLEEAADAPAPLVATPGKTLGNYGGTSFTRKTWHYEITDFDQIPPEWLVVDDRKVREAIRRADNPVRDIPGLRIYVEEQVVTR